jgi:large subunit ribosomal protein L25
MEIPVKIFGDSPGVQQGGKILMRIRKLSVMAYPKNMPEFIEVDISGLDLGKSIKVEDLLNEEFDILNSPVVSVVSVNIPRVKIEIEEEEEEGEEGAEGVTEGDEKKEGGSEGASEGGDKKEENKDS